LSGARKAFLSYMVLTRSGQIEASCQAGHFPKVVWLWRAGFMVCCSISSQRSSAFLQEASSGDLPGWNSVLIARSWVFWSAFRFPRHYWFLKRGLMPGRAFPKHSMFGWLALWYLTASAPRGHRLCHWAGAVEVELKFHRAGAHLTQLFWLGRASFSRSS
jgi:hypothetical protein